MGDPPPLRVDTPALNWDPAVVTAPLVPIIPPGGDPLSLMISSVMPGLAAPLTAAVAETQAREQRFAANLEGAKASYQTTDQAGEQGIRSVSDTQLAPTSAASGAAGAASGGSAGGQMGQMMNTVMQMAGQAVQAPMQVMGMAAQAPQAVMQGAQGAMQQFGQMSGQMDKAGGDGDKNAQIPVDQQPEQRDQDNQNKDQPPVKDGADAGPSTSERAPDADATQRAEPDAPGRHRVADPSDPINL